MLVLQYKDGIPPTPQPTFSNVVLLMKMDNNFTDVGSCPQTTSGSGGNTFSATTKKFGTHSAVYDGSGDPYTTVNASGGTCSASYDFGTGDFTVEAWVYPTAIPGGGVFYDMTVFGRLTSSPPMFFFLRNSDLAPCLWNGTFQHTSTSGVTPNQWSHVAWARASGTLRAFINGTEVLNVSEPTDFTNIGSCFIGGHGQITGRGFLGNIDEVRVTKGEAVYTGNFTAPTEAFPTS